MQDHLRVVERPFQSRRAQVRQVVAEWSSRGMFLMQASGAFRSVHQLTFDPSLVLRMRDACGAE